MLRRLPSLHFQLLALILCISYSGKMFEEVDAGEIVVIQHPISGELDVYTAAGTYAQYLGKATHYKRRSQIWFSTVSTNHDDTIDRSIKIQF
jgi:hypothetical protein